MVDRTGTQAPNLKLAIYDLNSQPYLLAYGLKGMWKQIFEIHHHSNILLLTSYIKHQPSHFILSTPTHPSYYTPPLF